MMQTSADDPSRGPVPPAAPGSLVPDTKDWTWTLHRPCPECGFEAASVPSADIATRVTASTDPWPRVLASPHAKERPDPATWSPLEYGCHVRDVCHLFEQRVRLMLTQEAPAFENWDQDETAVAQRYGEQEPAVVAREVVEAAAGLAGTYAAVPDDAWGRTGLRSDGSEFTVLTLGQYALHDLVHHLRDVGVPAP